MKKIRLPAPDELKKLGSPYLDIEIAAVKATIERAQRDGYRLKTIWRSLCESGDITGTYSGFRRALLRQSGSNEHADTISTNEWNSTSQKSRSERESEEALTEAKETLAARAKKRQEDKRNI